MEFQRVPLKFHNEYLTHTAKDTVFVEILKFDVLLNLRAHTCFWNAHWTFISDRVMFLLTYHGVPLWPREFTPVLRTWIWNYIHIILWDVITYLCPNHRFNTLRPRQYGRHFPDIFKCIFLNENVCILIKISLKFVPKGPINNIPALVQIMAWRRSGDKPLSEPMMVSLMTHICVTRPQWGG